MLLPHHQCIQKGQFMLAWQLEDLLSDSPSLITRHYLLHDGQLPIFKLGHSFVVIYNKGDCEINLMEQTIFLYKTPATILHSFNPVSFTSSARFMSEPPARPRHSTSHSTPTNLSTNLHARLLTRSSTGPVVLLLLCSAKDDWR